MNRLPRTFEEALFGPGSAARLVTTQSLLAAAIALRLALTPWARFADVPDALVDPVPPLAWIDGLPGGGVLVVAQIIGAIAGIAAAARRRPRLTFAIAWSCYLLLAAVRASRGKVLHNDLLLLWTAAVFLIAPIPDRPRSRVPNRLYGWPVRVAIAMTASIYSFAAYHKLRRSGLAWAFGENMAYVMQWAPIAGEPGAPGLSRWVTDRDVFLHLTAGSVLVVELLFPVVIWVRRTRPWFAAGAVALHVGTWLLLGLDYWMWAVTVLILLVDWPETTANLRRRLNHRFSARPGPNASAREVGHRSPA